MIDMTAITTKAEELEFDLTKVNRELKRLASVKHRLKKTPIRSDFNEVMTKTLQEEELLKCVKTYINGPRRIVSNLTQSDIDSLTLDETMKALKAIQSKKSHTKWLTTEPGNNDDYREACLIEARLKAHRDAMSPRKLGMVSKSDALEMLESLRIVSDLTAEECIDRIMKFIEEV